MEAVKAILREASTHQIEESLRALSAIDGDEQLDRIAEALREELEARWKI